MFRALPFLLLATPALAEADLAAKVAGQYGAVDNAAYSCAANPVQLSFTDNPPHALFTWGLPQQIFDDTTATEAVYDLVAEVPGGLILRLEGERRTTETGEPVLWVLRPDADFQGFCWGRMDWPVVQCVNPFARCDGAPVS